MSTNLLSFLLNHSGTVEAAEAESKTEVEAELLLLAVEKAIFPTALTFFGAAA